jgi:hypothetical protein
MRNNMPVTGGAAGVTRKALRIMLCATDVILLFSLYTWSISRNPLGIYLDESAAAYNAYLISRTGTGDSARGFL